MSEESTPENQADELRRVMDSMHRPSRAGTSDEQSTLIDEMKTVQEPQMRSRPHGGDSTAIDSSPEIAARKALEDTSEEAGDASDSFPLMRSMSESLASRCSVSLSEVLQTNFAMRLSGLRQVTVSQFGETLGEDSFCDIVKAGPFDTAWGLEISATLAYSIVDRMLGGDAILDDQSNRSLSEIETRLMRRFVSDFLSHLEDDWKQRVVLNLSPQCVDATAGVREKLTSSEDSVVISFEISLGERHGLMRLCLPQQFVDHLTSTDVEGEHQPCRSNDGDSNLVATSLESTSVSLVVNLASSKVKAADLLGLNVGDVISTEANASDPMELSIEGVAKYRVRAGAFRGKKAIQIESSINQPKTGN